MGVQGSVRFPSRWRTEKSTCRMAVSFSLPPFSGLMRTWQDALAVCSLRDSIARRFIFNLLCSLSRSEPNLNTFRADSTVQARFALAHCSLADP